MSNSTTPSLSSPTLPGSSTAPSASVTLPITTSDVISSTPVTTSQPVTSSPQFTTTTAPPSVVTSTVVQSASGSGGSGTTVVVQITTAGSTITQSVPASSASSAAAASSSDSSGFNSTTTNASSGPAPDAGKIAAAVVVPVVAIALIILASLYFWKKRKQRKDAEEARKKEMEEYSYNPNNDPTMPAVGSSNGDEAEPVGYRGWGNTSAATRKASTTLSSGMAKSDDGGNPYLGQYSPNGPNSEKHSGDPLMDQQGQAEPVGALGTGPVSGNRGNGMNRGPSNASSAYSGGANRSDTSGEGPPLHVGSPQYYNDVMYQDGAMPHDHVDGSWGGQPVIKDVSARRNTRIENPSVLPQQGNSGISQNF